MSSPVLKIYQTKNKKQETKNMQYELEAPLVNNTTSLNELDRNTPILHLDPSWSTIDHHRFHRGSDNNCGLPRRIENLVCNMSVFVGIANSCCEKLSHFGQGGHTRDAADRVWGVSHRCPDVSPASSCVHGYSTDVRSLFDTLEITGKCSTGILTVVHRCKGASA
jgi:hypothetical protein